jgi:hypothetical protein
VVRHPTYKHLEAKLRLGSLSLGQWVQIALAGTAAAVFGVYVSPLPASATVFVSIVAAGMPVAVSYGAMGLDFSVADFARAAWRYWRSPRRYVSGAGQLSRGYVVHIEQPVSTPESRGPRLADQEALWDF